MYAALDTETTGTDPKADDILSVAVILFDEDCRVVNKVHKFFRPKKNYIPEEASRINGITFDQVKNCPLFGKEAKQEIETFVAGCELVGHNVEFDLRFLALKLPKKTAIHDTLALSREKWPDAGRHNLESACNRAGLTIEKDKYHDAFEDTRQAMRLFLYFKFGGSQTALFEKAGAKSSSAGSRGAGLSASSALKALPSLIRNYRVYPLDKPSIADQSVVIPFDCPSQYHWWKSGGKKFEETLQELSA